MRNTAEELATYRALAEVDAHDLDRCWQRIDQQTRLLSTVLSLLKQHRHADALALLLREHRPSGGGAA